MDKEKAINDTENNTNTSTDNDTKNIIDRFKEKNIDINAVINSDPQLQSAVNYLQRHNLSLTDSIDVLDIEDGDQKGASIIDVDDDDDIISTEDVPITIDIKEDDDNFEESKIDSFF